MHTKFLTVIALDASVPSSSNAMKCDTFTLKHSLYILDIPMEKLYGT